jgi:hypothetical protein
MIALTLPVTSSIMRVEAGKPRGAASADVGTETTLTAVPILSIREGMKSTLWLWVWIEVLWGEQTPCETVKLANTEAIRVISSCGESVEVMLLTSESDKTKRDMTAWINDKFVNLHFKEALAHSFLLALAPLQVGLMIVAS